MKQDKLDKLLRKWAAGHAADEEHVRRLADRIVDQLGRLDRCAADEYPDRRPLSRPRGKPACVALGVAAALLIAAVASLVSRPPSASKGEPASSLASIHHSDVEAGARLFAEVKRIFGDELRWIADGGEVRLGLRPVSGGAAAATPLLIRVVVLQRKSGETAWHELLKTDVLTHNQELVEVLPNHGSDDRLVLWPYVLPDGNVAVDSSIRLTAPIRTSIEVTNVYAPGKPTGIFSLQTDDAEYRVFQVVIPLREHEQAFPSEA